MVVAIIIGALRKFNCHSTKKCAGASDRGRNNQANSSSDSNNNHQKYCASSKQRQIKAQQP